MSVSATPSANEPTQPNPLYLAAVDGESVAPEPSRPLKLTHGSHKNTKRWTEQTSYTLDALCEALQKYDFRDNKDGKGFIPATLLNATRSIPNVDEIFLLVYDIDGEQTLDEVRAILDAQPHLAWLYSTYNHKTTRTEIPAVHYEKWAKQAKVPATPTLEFLTRYFSEKGKDHLHNVAFDDVHGVEQVPDKGNCWIVTHDPLDKLRVVFPLSKPIKLHSLDVTNPNNAFKTIYHGHGRQLGLKYDCACDDPTRFYYFPSCPEDKARHVVALEYRDDQDTLLDWEKITRANIEERASKVSPKVPPSDTPRAKQRFPDGDFGNLPHWGMLANETFDIEGLLEERLADQILLTRSNGGYIITCPFEDEHTQPGGPGTFSVNAENAPEGHWTIYCSHNSCRSADRKRTDYLHKWLLDGLITLDDLMDHSGVAVPPSRVTFDSVKAAILTLSNKSVPAERDAIYDHVIRLSASEQTDCRKLIKDQTGLSLKDIDAGLKDAQKRRANASADGKEEKPRATPTGKLSLRNRRYDVKAYHMWQFAWSIADLADDVLSHLYGEKSDITKPSQVELYNSNGLLSELITDGDRVSIKPLENDALVKHIGDVAYWTHESDGEGYRYTISIPADVPRRILAVSDIPFAPLKSITFAPTFTADGTMILERGYHPSAGVYYHPPMAGLAVPEVPRTPTTGDVNRAAALLDDVLQDFPRNDGDGKNEGSRAHMLAHILQPCMRDLVDGPAPMFAIFKQLPGDGAGLFENVFSLINFGRLAAVSPVPKGTEGEWDKVLLTRAIEGAQHINFDNVPIGQRVDDGAFASALTAGFVEGRLLSLNKTANAALRGVISINGNKLQLSSELSRRCLPIRFDTETPDPLHRAKAFAHADLIGYVRTNRADFVWACLVLVQNWIAKGRPRWDGDPLPTFEEYSAVMGGILAAAGVTGFLGNRHLLRSQDQGDIALQAFAKVWHAKFGTEWSLVGESAKPFQGVVDLVSLYGQHSTSIDFWFNKKVEPENWSGPFGAYLSSRVGSTLDIGGNWVRIHKRRVAAGNQYRLEIVPMPAASGARNANGDQDSQD